MSNDKAIDDGNSGTVIAGGEAVGAWVGWEVTEGAIVDAGATVGATVGAGEIDGDTVGLAPSVTTTRWLL